MTGADSIWKGKMRRLRDPNPEKVEPLVGLMGGLRETRQVRAEPRSHALGAQEGVRRPWWRRVFEGR